MASRQQQIKTEITQLKKSIGKGSASKQVVKAVKLQIQELEKELQAVKLGGDGANQEEEKKEEEEEAIGGKEGVVGKEEQSDSAALTIGTDDRMGATDAHESRILNKQEQNQPKQLSKSKRKKNQKMALLEQERRLAAEEAKNMPNPKEIEDGEIDRLAYGMSRRVYQVAADGHCLYNAIARQLELVAASLERENLPLPLPTTYKELRRLAACWIRDHQDDFIPFLVNNNGDMMNQDEFNAYCQECEYGAVWGGHFEIQALSQALKRPIHILQADAPLLTIGQDEFGANAAPLLLSYHKHAYVLGEHYNSLEEIKESA